MALTDKDIVITPNRGQSADPKVEFKGASSTLGPQTISLNVYPTSNGTLSFEGSAGQLFSITNTLTGTIYSVNDVSGIPSIEVLDTGLVKLAQYSGNVLIGTGTDDGSKLQVRGSLRAGNGGWNSSPAGTTFSHTIAANTGNFRTVNFDGNGNTPSVWWTNGSRPYGAIDAQDPGLTFWAHNGSGWQKQITMGYGTVNIDTALQQGGNQVLHAGNYGSYALPLSGGTLTSSLTLGRDLVVNGNTGGNYGNRVIIGAADTSYTLQDTNLRPTLHLHGQYPVVSLNHTVTSNTNHGPTLQFTSNGTGSQFVIGTNGTGTMLSMGYSSGTNWNPHNGIAGHDGTSFFQAGTNGYIGIGSEGDWSLSGGTGTHVPGYNLHFIGSNNATNGHAAFFDNRVNGANNGSGFLFRNLYGNHSWGIVAEYRVEGTAGTDRPSILFSHGYNSYTWSVGFGYADDQFRIRQNHGHRNGDWGTERFRIDTGGTPYFNGNVALHAGNYNSYAPTLTGGSASGTWGISITGNADTVDNYHVAVAGSANTIPTRNSSGYFEPNNWIQFNSTYGLYAPTNDAHFHPNDQDYGSWRIRGTRNGWYGIYFDSGSTLMMNSSEVGFHRSGVGWQMWWSGGTGYVHKGNPGGGTQATILDSANYTNYTNGVFLRAAGNNDAMNFNTTQYNTMYYAYIANSPNKPPGYNYSYGTIITFDPGVGAGGRAQFYVSHAGNDLIFRGGWNANDSWQTWNRVLTDQNYTSWAPSLTGSGASGTWAISITGSAGSAGSSPWASLTGNYREDYNIGFRPAAASESYAGFRFGTVGGDANAGYLLIRNGSDNDVYTQNGITLVADTGWLTLAQRTQSDKGVRIMSGATSTERVKVTSAGDIQFVNGNSINYNTGRMIYGDNYAGSEPYNTGSIGRSGLNVNQIFERRSGFIDVWASGGTNTSGSTHDTGFQSMHYWDGTTGYGVQIAGNHGVRDTLKFRWRSDNGINPWYNILNSANYNSYSPTLTGGGASGTWGINITGNAATATSATDSTKLPLTGGTVTGATYFQSNLGATSGSLSGPPLQAFATGGNSAFMSFHRSGNYAVNFGLDSDNVLRIGGWSASTNRWQLDMDGNNTIPGRLTANAWTTYARNYSHEWIEFPNYSGLYSPLNGAHFYPNNATYGSWRIAGARNGWYGIYFDSGSTLMMNSETLGFYRADYGWQFYWSAGTGYVSKGNPGGGTIATILESSNYTSYSPSLTGSGASGTWNINITGSAATATDSTKVPLSGGTMTGTLFINSKLRVNNASGPSDNTYGTAADIPMHMSGNTRTQTTFLIENTVNSSIDYPVIVIRRTLTPVGSRFGGMIRFADKNSSGTEISSQIYSFNRLTSQDLFLDAGSGTEDRVVLRAGSSSSMQVAENFIMNVKAAIYAVTTPAALDIDCKQSNFFTKTINGDSTFTFSNVPAPSGFTIAYSFTLELTHTSGTVTWPASVRWPGNVLPSLTTGKTHLFMFVTDDGGSRWRGSFLSNYDN